MSKFYFLFAISFIVNLHSVTANPLDSCDIYIYIHPKNICRGDSLGSVSYKIKKAVPPYEIQTNFENKDSLEVGEYFILVTDSLGCSDSVHFEIFKPEPFEAGIKLYNNGCSPSMMCGLVNDSENNFSFYNYSWSNGIISRCTEASLGTWRVDISDIYGCIENASITIDTSDISGIFIGYFPNTMIPFCQDSLELESNVYGNTEGAKYNWTGPHEFSSTESSIFVSDTGDYSLVVNNAKGCSDTKKITIGKRSVEIEASFRQQNCTNKLTKVFFNIKGVKGPYTIDYPKLWTITDSLPVTIMDDDGCIFEKNIAVPNQTPFSVIIEPFNDLTCTQDSIIICPIIQGGTEPYSYTWNTDAGIEMDNSSCGILTDMGGYNLEVVDSNGCIANKEFYINSNTDIPNNVYTVGGLILTCSNPTTMLCANVSDCDSCSIIWSTLNGHIVGNADTTCIEVNESGEYELTFTNSISGCSTTSLISIIDDFTKPDIKFPQEEIIIKKGDCADLTFTTSAPNVSANWQNADGISIGSTPNVCEAGIYKLTLTNLDNGCTNSRTMTVEIETANINLTSSTIQINPNPTFDLIEIIFSNMVQGTVSIYSLHGQLLQEKTIENRTVPLDLTNLPNGVYFLKIESKKGIYYKKIIKQ